jgi:hypothetical protein
MEQTRENLAHFARPSWAQRRCQEACCAPQRIPSQPPEKGSRSSLTPEVITNALLLCQPAEDAPLVTQSAKSAEAPLITQPPAHAPQFATGFAGFVAPRGVLKAQSRSARPLIVVSHPVMATCAQSMRSLLTAAMSSLRCAAFGDVGLPAGALTALIASSAAAALVATVLARKQG